jgi:hypothetical protein
MKYFLFIGQSLLQQGQFSKASRVRRMVWRVCHRTTLALLSTTTKLINLGREVKARLRHDRDTGKRQDQAKLVSEKTLADIYMDT